MSSVREVQPQHACHKCKEVKPQRRNMLYLHCGACRCLCLDFLHRFAMRGVQHLSQADARASGAMQAERSTHLQTREHSESGYSGMPRCSHKGTQGPSELPNWPVSCCATQLLPSTPTCSARGSVGLPGSGCRVLGCARPAEQHEQLGRAACSCRQAHGELQIYWPRRQCFACRIFNLANAVSLQCAMHGGCAARAWRWGLLRPAQCAASVLGRAVASVAACAVLGIMLQTAAAMYGTTVCPWPAGTST